MKKLYHVTLMENVESILKDGLIPQIGERSREFGEEFEAVYMFPSIDDMECALGQWLGEWYNDEYGEEIPLASLEITVPDQFPIENGVVEYEVFSKIIIPGKFIKFLREE